MNIHRAANLVRVFLVALIVTFALTVCDMPSGPELGPEGGDATPVPESVDQDEASRINVLFEPTATTAEISSLSRFGQILGQFRSIRAIVLSGRLVDLDAIRALPFVSAANPDAIRTAAPVFSLPVSDFADGEIGWDLDAVDVGNSATGREISATGDGVYVAVLDTGLMRSWPYYFPRDRISSEYATSFGGFGPIAWEQPERWEKDLNSHGLHVTSSIIGYNFEGTEVNGVAPLATIIPVKVLNQLGIGFSSTIALGIEYIADLKAGPLAESPVIINMSLGGPELDAVEQNAIDYALAMGVIIVASAGNEGATGMGYPGAYEPVISVAASGWTEEWTATGWPLEANVADPTNVADFYITEFSSRELQGQDLDVAAPGSWILGPYQVQPGLPSYYYLGGTSMASPHVAGVVALMAESNSTLSPAEAERILEATAFPLPAGTASVYDPILEDYITVVWGEDATGAGLVNTAGAIQASMPQ